MGKILLCGDGAVGKTSLRNKFLGIGFKSRYLATIGADISIKMQKVIFDNKEYSIKFYIWDLAGQPNYSIIRPHYYQGGHAALLVYDITNRSTFDSLNNWINEIKKSNTFFPIPMILVANKIDLKDQVDDSISSSEGKNLATTLTLKHDLTNYNISFIETSAKTGENVEFTFEELGKQLVKIGQDH
ncbi:MAG: Rab family GTPase [Candidatus Hodarchaeales archaeon]|jgi:small GTP-binding protein